MSEKFQRLNNEEEHDGENSTDISSSNNGISMSLELTKSTDRLTSSDDSIQVQFSLDEDHYPAQKHTVNSEDGGNNDDNDEPPTDLEPSPKAAKSMEKDDTITCFFGLTRYQFLVLFSAWVGWGFDLFDSLLFTYAAPVCIPYLLGLDPTVQEARDQIALWTAILTSLLLLGWAAGGILFGVICDKIGRARTMFFTIVTYSISTALCAASWNIWILALFRFTSALGIGGEWAAGASLVAETLPERKRILGGVILYTAAPIGGLLGFLVNLVFTSTISDDVGANGLSWRLVFLSALIPVAITCFIRAKVKEPEMFAAGSASGNLKMLMAHPFLKRTLASLVLTITSLITWWCISTFIPIIFIQLASDETGGDKVEAKHRARIYTSIASVLFYIGGFFGTIANYPLSKKFGRIAMLRIFLGGSFILLPITFLPVASMPVGFRLTMLFFLGGFVTAIFALFIFYLPEQFPTYLRATGAGFTYNAGRCITAVFPFLVGMLIQGGYNPMKVVVFISIVPFITFIFLFFNVALETKDLDLYKNDNTNKNGVEMVSDNNIQMTSAGRI